MRVIFNTFLIALGFTFAPLVGFSKNNQDIAVSQNGGSKLQMLEMGPLSNKEAIADDPLLPEIVDHLQKKYGVSTVILYGSRARGTATSTSDYDILALRESGEKKNYFEIFKGNYLDISVYPQSFDEDDFFNALSALPQEAIILSQSHHEGERFINRIKEFSHLSPKEPTGDPKNSIRMLVTNFKRSQANNIREQFYRHKFLYLALRYYFPIRGLICMGVRNSFEWLEKHDPLTYAAFKKALASGASPEAQFELLERVIGSASEIHQVRQELANDFYSTKAKEKYDAKKDKLLPEILAYIQAKYGAHTVILMGSRAQGTATPKSDYDIIALRDEGTADEDPRDLFKEMYLDIHLFPETTLNEELPRLIGLGVFEGAIILAQKGNLGERYIQHRTKLYSKGFTFSDETKQEVANQIKMDLFKVNDTLVGRFYFHQVISQLLEHYFTFRNLFYIGSRGSFSWIKKNDLLTYKAFEKALKPGASRESLKELVERVIAPTEKNALAEDHINVNDTVSLVSSSIKH